MFEQLTTREVEFVSYALAHGFGVSIDPRSNAIALELRRLLLPDRNLLHRNFLAIRGALNACEAAPTWLIDGICADVDNLERHVVERACQGSA